MKRLLAVSTALLLTIPVAPAARGAQPFVQVETGIVARDVVEEDASIEGFKADGRAQSTRVLATVGVAINDFLTVYVQGGGADLAIDDFNGFDSSFAGAFGGGIRLDLYTSPHRDRLRLFVEGSILHSELDDTVMAEFGCTAANGCTAGAWGDYIPRLVDETIEWNEYTVMMGVGWQYGPFAPYGGVRLSKVDAEDTLRAAPDGNFASAFRFEADLREQDNFGVFFGTDMWLDRTGNTVLNFEVSLFDQDSFRAAIRRSF